MSGPYQVRAVLDYRIIATVATIEVTDGHKTQQDSQYDPSGENAPKDCGQPLSCGSRGGQTIGAGEDQDGDNSGGEAGSDGDEV